MSFSLGSDNHSGIHPRIAEAILRLNVGHAPAYGTDDVTEEANKTVKAVFGASCEPYFLFNGTAANVLCLRSLIESHEAVITADTAHLQLDECGAPENTIGCKLLLVPSADGKITPEGIEKHLIRLGDQHYAQPKVVSITLPTELGTCYTMAELKMLREYTHKNNLYLHIDGARLIYAAHFLKCSLRDITEGLGADAVSFGGTKNGLLFGEIALLYNDSAKKKFKYIRKQNMQLPSKMRFLAGQFQEFLREPGLYREVAEHGHAMAKYLAAGLKEFPEVKITQKVEANALFVQIPKDWFKPLRDAFFFYVWDEHEFVMRWMISFDVTKNDIDAFLNLMRKLSRK
jgi:threonine aldolase